MKARILALSLAVSFGAAGLTACASDEDQYEETILGYLEGKYNGDPDAFRCPGSPHSTNIMDTIPTPAEDRPTLEMEVFSTEKLETHTRLFFKLTSSKDGQTSTTGQLAKLRQNEGSYCVEEITTAQIEGTDNYALDLDQETETTTSTQPTTSTRSTTSESTPTTQASAISQPSLPSKPTSFMEDKINNGRGPLLNRPYIIAEDQYFMGLTETGWTSAKCDAGDPWLFAGEGENRQTQIVICEDQADNSIYYRGFREGGALEAPVIDGSVTDGRFTVDAAPSTIKIDGFSVAVFDSAGAKSTDFDLQYALIPKKRPNEPFQTSEPAGSPGSISSRPRS